MDPPDGAARHDAARAVDARALVAFVPVAVVLSLAPGERLEPEARRLYVALFPQFVPAGALVLASALLMAATIVAVDLVWYSVLAYAVARARRAFVEGPWARRVERVTCFVLVGLGVRLALERR